jgi:hypothetical protein
MPLCAGTELLLFDGTVLDGVSVQRLEGNYLLTTEDGQAITVPVEVVESVRLRGGTPTGMRTGEPVTLADETVVLPRRPEQRENLVLFL